jgi:hypothetical protein
MLIEPKQTLRNPTNVKGSQMNFIGDFMTPDELAAELAKTGGYGNIRDL